MKKFFSFILSDLMLTLLGLSFTFLNYSKLSWQFFYKIGGLALAKVAPEAIGIFGFSLLAFLAWKKLKIHFNILLFKKIY